MRFVCKGLNDLATTMKWRDMALVQYIKVLRDMTPCRMVKVCLLNLENVGTKLRYGVKFQTTLTLNASVWTSNIALFSVSPRHGHDMPAFLQKAVRMVFTVNKMAVTCRSNERVTSCIELELMTCFWTNYWKLFQCLVSISSCSVSVNS